MKNKINEAKKAYNNSYSPYSNFAVGAALELQDGTFIHGTNVENGSFGLSNCAERSALFAAYSLGYKKEDFKSLTVIANYDHPISPCGACRQVLHELFPSDAPITLTNLKGEIQETSTNELLPFAFALKDDE